MKFTAEKVIFQNEPGYILVQSRDGKEVANQFISEEHFSEFCKAAGITPDMITFIGGVA